MEKITQARTFAPLHGVDVILGMSFCQEFNPQVVVSQRATRKLKDEGVKATKAEEKKPSPDKESGSVPEEMSSSLAQRACKTIL